MSVNMGRTTAVRGASAEAAVEPRDGDGLRRRAVATTAARVDDAADAALAAAPDAQPQPRKRTYEELQDDSVLHARCCAGATCCCLMCTCLLSGVMRQATDLQIEASNLRAQVSSLQGALDLCRQIRLPR